MNSKAPKITQTKPITVSNMITYVCILRKYRLPTIVASVIKMKMNVTVLDSVLLPRDPRKSRVNYPSARSTNMSASRKKMPKGKLNW